LTRLRDGTAPHAPDLRGLVIGFDAEPMRGHTHTHHDWVDLDHVSREREALRPRAVVKSRVGDGQHLADLDRTGNV
jgi:hypothetical protein